MADKKFWSEQPRVANTKPVKNSEIERLDRMHAKASAKANSLANLKNSIRPPGQVNAKRKGSKNEHRTMALLEAAGYAALPSHAWVTFIAIWQ